MPELPEVETTRRGIEPHLLKATITSVLIRQRKLRWPITPDLATQLPQQTILNITRRGKYLLFTLNKGTLLIHLGMSGRLTLLQKSKPPAKHDHVDFYFSNQLILRFTDPRRFGAILYFTEDPAYHPLLKHIGVEPLTRDFTANYLVNKIKLRKISIKSCLLNGRIVAGIGNIYATEALYLAGIDPRKPGCQLSLNEVKKLVVAVKNVLRHALLRGGTTLKDFLQTDGNPGQFHLRLAAYGKAKQNCRKCHQPMRSIRIAARSTVYCAHCQR